MSVKLVTHGLMNRGSKVAMTLMQYSSTADGSISHSLKEAANKVSLLICASWSAIPETMVHAGKIKLLLYDILIFIIKPECNHSSNIFFFVSFNPIGENVFLPASILVTVNRCPVVSTLTTTPPRQLSDYHSISLNKILHCLWVKKIVAAQQINMMVAVHGPIKGPNPLAINHSCAISCQMCII
jgi:hypothetical protein